MSEREELESRATRLKDEIADFRRSKGKRSHFPVAIRQAIRELVSEGYGAHKLALKVGLSVTTIARWCKPASKASEPQVRRLSIEEVAQPLDVSMRVPVAMPRSFVRIERGSVFIDLTGLLS